MCLAGTAWLNWWKKQGSKTVAALPFINHLWHWRLGKMDGEEMHPSCILKCRTWAERLEIYECVQSSLHGGRLATSQDEEQAAIPLIPRASYSCDISYTHISYIPSLWVEGIDICKKNIALRLQNDKMTLSEVANIHWSELLSVHSRYYNEGWAKSHEDIIPFCVSIFQHESWLPRLN